MNRRSFLRFAVGGIATAAAVRTFPFRVFSFANKITIATRPALGGYVDLGRMLDFSPLPRPLILVHPEELKYLRSLRDIYGRPLWDPLKHSNVPPGATVIPSSLARIGYPIKVHDDWLRREHHPYPHRNNLADFRSAPQRRT
jgi:hypothetical protein